MIDNPSDPYQKACVYLAHEFEKAGKTLAWEELHKAYQDNQTTIIKLSKSMRCEGQAMVMVLGTFLSLGITTTLSLNGSGHGLHALFASMGFMLGGLIINEIGHTKDRKNLDKIAAQFGYPLLDSYS